MRTVTIPNKQIELTEAEVEQAVQNLARQKAEEDKTVPLVNGSCVIFTDGHPMRSAIQIRTVGRYRERGLWLNTINYDLALLPDEFGVLVLTVTKKAEMR